MKKLIEYLKEDLLAAIIVIIFGSFLIYDFFIDKDPYYSDEESNDLQWEEYAEQEMVKDHLLELERQEQEAELYAPLYYINNGYYFHNYINCKGLDGYRNNLNTTYIEELIEHPELSACNWCVKGYEEY